MSNQSDRSKARGGCGCLTIIAILAIIGAINRAEEPSAGLAFLFILACVALYYILKSPKNQPETPPPSPESAAPAPESPSPKPRREPIPRSVQMYVWQRDGGRCVECGSNERLEYDHIIPLSKGGSNTDRNLQLLCQRCNRSKGAKIGG